MRVARVVGNIWATRKHEGLKNSKLLLVQPIERDSGKVNNFIMRITSASGICNKY